MSRERKNPAAVALGRLGGRVKSDAKTAAARRNALRGGRPQRLTVRDLAAINEALSLRLAGEIDDPDLTFDDYEQAQAKIQNLIAERATR